MLMQISIDFFAQKSLLFPEKTNNDETQSNYIKKLFTFNQLKYNTTYIK